jgi:predicted dehydrogenase
VHALDAICWWIGKPDLVSCRTDSYGGPEAVASVKFQLKSCKGEVRVSWLAQLRNQYSIEADGGHIFGNTKDWRKLTLRLSSAEPKIIEVGPTGDFSKLTSDRMIDNFLDVISGDAEPLILGREVVESIELIDECYSAAERFSMPWCDRIEHI